MPNNTQDGVSQHHGRHRLQRGPTPSGYRVTTFRDVLQRHGLTMACLATVCLLLPGSLSAIATTTSRLILQPAPYLFALLGFLVFFSMWSRRRPHTIARQTQWILYLLFISLTEEIIFRLVFPAIITPPCNWLGANILSNLIFASIHYFTLRWKLRNCIATFIGAMGLSQLMTHGDLVLVVMAHWLGTFLNTPFPPTGQNRQDEGGRR